MKLVKIKKYTIVSKNAFESEIQISIISPRIKMSPTEMMIMFEKEKREDTFGHGSSRALNTWGRKSPYFSQAQLLVSRVHVKFFVAPHVNFPVCKNFPAGEKNSVMSW